MEKPVINQIFRPILDNKDSRYFLLTGGRGSGKSFAIAWSILMLSFEPGHTILYTRKTMVSADKSIIPEFQGMIERMGLDEAFSVTSNQIVNDHSGSTIWFMGLKSGQKDNTARLKSLSGVTTWIIDEFEDLANDEELFDRIDLSIRHADKQNRIIMSMNPTTKEFWAYDRFITEYGITPKLYESSTQEDDLTYIHTTWENNADNLSDSFVKNALKTKARDGKKYEEQFLGGWKDKQDGVIIKNWEYGKFEYHSAPLFGLDFGYNDPCAMVEVSIDSTSRRIFVKLHCYESELVESDIRRIINQKTNGRLVIADCQSKMTIEGLRRSGVNITSCKKGPDTIIKGLDIIRDHTLIVDPESRMLVRELNNYVWRDRSNDERSAGDEPIDKFNHAIDALRYVVYYELLHKYSEDLNMY